MRAGIQLIPFVSIVVSIISNGPWIFDVKGEVREQKAMVTKTIKKGHSIYGVPFMRCEY
jgi:hypothetical protein